MITKEQILKALSQVMEPELKKDMVSLNMIQDINIEGNKISFNVILTTPACPLKNEIKAMCEKAVLDITGNEYAVTANLTSKVSSNRGQEDVLNGVKNIIIVASGKGGVGKSTVASNLAVGLAKNGAKTGLIDADIYGPSIPIMFNVENEQPYGKEIDGKQKIIPLTKYEVKLLSIGFFVDPEQALVWRGPMAANALKQLITDGEWGELDYLIIDLPPGTGDIQLTLTQTVPVTGVVIVTTPQKVALADAEKGINMFKNKDINVPILGLVENMSYFSPPDILHNKYYIFGKEGGKKLASKYGLTLLGEIPITETVMEGGDTGAPVIMESSTPIAKSLMKMTRNVASAVSIRNAMMGE